MTYSGEMNNVFVAAAAPTLQRCLEGFSGFAYVHGVECVRCGEFHPLTVLLGHQSSAMRHCTGYVKHSCRPLHRFLRASCRFEVCTDVSAHFGGVRCVHPCCGTDSPQMVRWRSQAATVQQTAGGIGFATADKHGRRSGHAMLHVAVMMGAAAGC